MCTDCEKKILNKFNTLPTENEIKRGEIYGIYYKLNIGVAFDYPVADTKSQCYIITKPGFKKILKFSDYKINWSYDKKDLF